MGDAMEDVLKSIIHRNEFYRRQFHLALAAFCLGLIVIGILSWICIKLIENPPLPYYFATDNLSRLLPSVPLSSPNMTSDQVINWAIEATESVMSIDYINYREQLQEAQKYFTDYGWRQYWLAAQGSNNLAALTNRNMVWVSQVLTLPPDQPQILATGLISGAYAWQIQMKVVTTFMTPPFDDKSKYSNAYVLTMKIQRRPLLSSYKGLGIVQWILVPASS